MPPAWVGFLISFTPISMTLIVATGLLVMRWGPKRVMLVGWMLRNLVVCTVFLMPWAMARGGPRTAWYVLTGSALGFCFMRAIGAGGWLPWLHEVVPEGQRGAYFSAEAAVTQLLNVVVALVQALVLRGDPGVNRFLVVYGVGIGAGFISLMWMYRVPGGQATTRQPSIQADVASYRSALADRSFLRFVMTASLCLSSTSWLGASAVLYMRDGMSLSSRTIMVITAIGSIGVMVTIRRWARFAERRGSARGMSLALAGHALAALTCLGLIPGASWTPYALGPVMVLASMFGSAFWMTTNRAMLNYVKASNRVGYTNLWTLVTSMALGLTPILAGMAINYGHIWGFRLCFAIAGLAGLACARISRRVVKDHGPVQPMSDLAGAAE
jgi:hypothetical protein